MRAAPEFRGKGAGEAILKHLLGEAEARGYGWLGLETGGADEFLPAVKLYEKYRFSECPAFGDYVSDEFSVCMDRAL
jgi:putative acetyltransferase